MNNGDKQVSIRFTSKDIECINAACQKGHGMNVVDFVRSATREKIVEIGIKTEVDKTTQMIFQGGT
jgi:hypothetical protein